MNPRQHRGQPWSTARVRDGGGERSGLPLDTTILLAAVALVLLVGSVLAFAS